MGFNLIEAAIVLGVVGVIVGAIWVAASAIRNQQKVNETASIILQTSRQARIIFKEEIRQASTAYPITNAAYLAGAVPQDLVYASGLVSSPIGASFEIWLHPSHLGIRFYGPASSAPSKLSPENCTVLVRTFGTLARNAGENGGSSVQVGASTVNPSGYTCASNFNIVTFWFSPF